jgi:hypothetical protein
MRERSVGAPPVVGETSPYYLFHPAAPARIKETTPDALLIAVLREPVSRAYSNYWDRVATGAEDLPTFEQAIDAENERLRTASELDFDDPRAYDYHHDHHSYLARGEYAGQLRRYFELFDREQLLVLSADSLFRDSKNTFDRIQSFLGLELVRVPLTPRNVREGYPEIAPLTRERLRAYYAPHNTELTELMGEDFGW